MLTISDQAKVPLQKESVVHSFRFSVKIFSLSALTGWTGGGYIFFFLLGTEPAFGGPEGMTFIREVLCQDTNYSFFSTPRKSARI